ncbi:hypothetical protein [Bradyrhizobium australafricanum]|uniref:hypothetical protein n=1 Tax=Bradyrhizobium australafricanum TaxID=2821406 RepID=UPI001CE2AA4B|nr:hypothetical protein [Bradyrhizobium australafricanum]MCA6100722.1 hypothetical protein [Bradyrhizobium australafricanum]
MCDYSLHAVASRPAKLGDTLIATGFHGTATRGFAAMGQPAVAVYLLPGTELTFDHDVKYRCNRFFTRSEYSWIRSAGFSMARFCKIDPLASDPHRDALSFPDGTMVLVNMLEEWQCARVIQLPVVERQRQESTIDMRGSRGSLSEAHPAGGAPELMRFFETSESVAGRAVKLHYYT